MLSIIVVYMLFVFCLLERGISCDLFFAWFFVGRIVYHLIVGVFCYLINSHLKAVYFQLNVDKTDTHPSNSYKLYKTDKTSSCKLHENLTESLVFYVLLRSGISEKKSYRRNTQLFHTMRLIELIKFMYIWPSVWIVPSFLRLSVRFISFTPCIFLSMYTCVAMFLLNFLSPMLSYLKNELINHINDPRQLSRRARPTFNVF